MSEMLNLKIGGFYKFKCAQGGEYAGQIRAKSIHDKRTHTYFMAWPNARDKGSPNPIGLYIWDYGWANKWNGVCWFSNPIIECHELTNKERDEMIAKFQRLGQHMI